MEDYEEEDVETNGAEPRLDELMAKMAGEPGHDISGSDTSLIEVVVPPPEEDARPESGQPLPEWAASLVKPGRPVEEAADDEETPVEGGNDAVPRVTEKPPKGKGKR